MVLLPILILQSDCTLKRASTTIAIRWLPEKKAFSFAWKLLHHLVVRFVLAKKSLQNTVENCIFGVFSLKFDTRFMVLRSQSFALCDLWVYAQIHVFKKYLNIWRLTGTRLVASYKWCQKYLKIIQKTVPIYFFDHIESFFWKILMHLIVQYLQKYQSSIFKF